MATSLRDFPPPSEYAKMLSTAKGIRLAFNDPILKSARVELDSHQLPRVRSGAFAVVYKMNLPDGRSQALRLFLKDGGDRRERYALICEHLSAASLSCLVPFAYHEEAFRAADGKRYPMMTMDWVDGETLFDWLRGRVAAADKIAIRVLASKWQGVVSDLRRAEIAHGDLQHANVMVTQDGELKLVDYDGMCVPKLVGRRNLEIGVDPYQHPGRDANTLLSLSLDNFPALVLYVSLVALAAEPRLWNEFVEKRLNEKILFLKEDFENSEKSALFQCLLSSSDPQVQRLSATLAELWKKPLSHSPSLGKALGPFDFADVLSSLDRGDYDNAVRLLDMHGKVGSDIPAEMQSRVRDGRLRVAKLNDLVEAVQCGDEKLMYALSASPLLKNYPAAERVLVEAEGAKAAIPVLARLQGFAKCSRWRELVNAWDRVQHVLTEPNGRLRASAVSLAREVEIWRGRNEACDRVRGCIRQSPVDVAMLAKAWGELQAIGGHPELMPLRYKIESIIRGSSRGAGGASAAAAGGGREGTVGEVNSSSRTLGDASGRVEPESHATATEDGAVTMGGSPQSGTAQELGRAWLPEVAAAMNRTLSARARGANAASAAGKTSVSRSRSSRPLGSRGGGDARSVPPVPMVPAMFPDGAVPPKPQAPHSASAPSDAVASLRPAGSALQRSVGPPPVPPPPARGGEQASDGCSGPGSGGK